MNNKTIAYILGEFPSHTETFVKKEILYITDSFPVYVIALKKGKGNLTAAEFNKLENRLIYITPFILIKSILYQIYCSYKEKSILQEWKKLMHTIFKVNIRISLHQIKLVSVGVYLSKIIRQKAIQHIHAHFANYPADVAMLLSEFTKIPFSFTAHANDIYVNGQNLAQKIHAAAFVTTCTSYNQVRLKKMASISERTKIHLLYHGVDRQYWQYIPPQNRQYKKQLLFVGRLVEKKGIIYLLEAMRQIIKKDVAVRLVIAGRGTEEQKLKKHCLALGLEKVVTFVGWQSPQQIKQLYADSSLFISPSLIASNGDRDGIPNVLLEAMASGVPVISTPVSGIKELILNKYNGVLIPQKNSQMLADAIFLLLKDARLQILLSQNAYQMVVQKFDHAKCNCTLKALFNK